VYGDIGLLKRGFGVPECVVGCAGDALDWGGNIFEIFECMFRSKLGKHPCYTVLDVVVVPWEFVHFYLLFRCEVALVVDDALVIADVRRCVGLGAVG
jgi:hypothetical protein